MFPTPSRATPYDFPMFDVFSQAWLLLAIPIALIILYQFWTMKRDRKSFAEMRSIALNFIGRKVIPLNLENMKSRIGYAKYIEQIYFAKEMRSVEPEPKHIDISGRVYIDIIRRAICKNFAIKSTALLLGVWIFFIIVWNIYRKF